MAIIPWIGEMASTHLRNPWGREEAGPEPHKFGRLARAITNSGMITWEPIFDV